MFELGIQKNWIDALYARSSVRQYTGAPDKEQLDRLGETCRKLSWQGVKIRMFKGPGLKSQIKGGETERALQSAVTHDMRAFAATEPGFVDAFGFFTQRLDSVLQAIGHDNPEVRAGEIKRQTREIVTQAMQSRRSGAAALFAAAKAMGWSAKPANDPTAEAAKAGAAELQKLTDAQKANASLRGAGTSAAPDALTPGKLADMGDAEYSRARDGYIAKHGRGAWNKLVFGG